MNDMIVHKLKLSYWLYLSKSSTANCHIASILSGKDLSFDIKEQSCNNGRVAVAHWIKMRPSLQPFPPSFSNSRSRPFTNGEVEVVDNSKAFPAATPFQPQESFAATTTTIPPVQQWSQQQLQLRVKHLQEQPPHHKPSSDPASTCSSSNSTSL